MGFSRCHQLRDHQLLQVAIFTPDNSHIFSISVDKYIRIWNTVMGVLEYKHYS
jgi:WD40 repeat protein